MTSDLQQLVGIIQENDGILVDVEAAGRRLSDARSRDDADAESSVRKDFRGLLARLRENRAVALSLLTSVPRPETPHEPEPGKLTR
jgi:hypothetical protein